MWAGAGWGGWGGGVGAGVGVGLVEEAQENGMGFENKHLLEKMKGRNWCYTEKAFSVGRALTLNMVNSCFHLVLNVELVLGTQDR